jgi:pyruvate/2-oxoglutarate dehydrogenase complex dihydrolipoamide acyltransferase (E2) component
VAQVEIRIEDADPGEEVEVVEINVAVGDKVTSGQALMEVASDKANMDLTSPVDGTVTELKVAQFDVVASDVVFAVVSDG